MNVSGLSVGYHTILVKICSTANFASFKNDWIKVYVKNRVEAIGGTLASTNSTVSQLIYTEGADTAYWDTSCNIKQDGLMKKLRIKCSGYALVGGYLVVKVNGVVKKTEAVPLSRWDIYTDVDVSNIAVGGNIAIEAGFHTSPNINSVPADSATIQYVDTDRRDGIEVYITSKAVQTRTYTVRSKPLEAERTAIAGAVTTMVKEGNVAGSIVTSNVDGHGAAYTEIALTYRSQSRAIPKLKQYGGSLELAAPSEEEPDPDRDRIFGYDETGNRNSVEENLEEDAYVIDPGNRVKETGDEIFTYDDNGNMIGRENKATGEIWAYIYDARNCMTEVQKGGGSVRVTVARYVYDPEGNRIKAFYPQKDGTNDEVYYHYDYTGLLTENPIVEEPMSGPKRNFIFLGRKLFARVDGDIGSGAKYWYMTDHLGSAHGLMDQSGDMVWWADYEAFGKAKGVGGPDSGAVDEMPRFTGKAFDERIGLYYFNARWYDPELARFVNEDSIRDGVNWHCYVGNNPLINIDPLGLSFDYGGGGGGFILDGGGGGGTSDTGGDSIEGRENSITPSIPEEDPLASEFSKESREKVQNLYRDFANLYPDGEVSHETVKEFADQNGLTRAEFLYLCQIIAFHNERFAPGYKGDPPNSRRDYGQDPNKPTWCNSYTAYVLYLFTGSKELMNNNSSADPELSGNFTEPTVGWALGATAQLNYVSDKAAAENGWKLVSAEEAQAYANAGYFVLAAAPGHVATVAPGEGKESLSTGLFYPNIAQAGKNMYLAGYTTRDTMNWGFGSGTQYYVKI